MGRWSAPSALSAEPPAGTLRAGQPATPSFRWSRPLPQIEAALFPAAQQSLPVALSTQEISIRLSVSNSARICAFSSTSSSKGVSTRGSAYTNLGTGQSFSFRAGCGIQRPAPGTEPGSGKSYAPSKAASYGRQYESGAPFRFRRRPPRDPAQTANPTPSVPPARSHAACVGLNAWNSRFSPPITPAEQV